ncbi:MAG: 4Fe-4S ferredoxin [Planctomycetia bacterium]|nr:4Fe-4S ferredoxin [Planctomycetia bacterium]
MVKLEDHPTVIGHRRRLAEGAGADQPGNPRPLVASDLRTLAIECGADDVGFVSLDRPELSDQLTDIRHAFPAARAAISFVCRMNREPVRSPARSVANLEFHATTHHVDAVARAIVARLDAQGVRALNASAGFPMETARFPDKMWVVSHKPVAVAAGLGMMGIHRNVIHPKFGNFILLGTVLVDRAIDEESRPIDYNPCLSCKLCVAACPVGAIRPDGGFNPSACLTHNYREFMSGFTDWVEQVVESRDAADYRRRVTDQESVSMWQSLGYNPNYKAAYCLAVCPAGEDVIGPYLADRGGFATATLKPLTDKVETIYVVADSDAEDHVTRKFPHKKPKRVGGVRPVDCGNFIRGLHVVFQPGRAKGLDAVYHFTFTGAESLEATVAIRDQRVDVTPGLVGRADCAVTADAATWTGFLRKERNIVWAILRRQVRVRGPLRLLTAFGRCFPS